MLSALKRLFTKNSDRPAQPSPAGEEATFQLKVDDIVIGVLHCEKGAWEFAYTEEFKGHADEYNRIIGFSDLNKK